MESWIRALVEGIHVSPTQAVLLLSGGSSQALGWLMSVPGASGTILEAVVPYSKNSMSNLLGKGLRNREEEDKISSQILIKAIADACNIISFNEFNVTLNESEVPKVSEKCYNEDEELNQLINAQICMKIYQFSKDEIKENFERRIILSGSFNPLHDGHIKLLEIASCMYENENIVQYFEISAINADKPPLSIEEIKLRVNQFRKAGKNVIISNQPYFYKKAELFPGSVFVIGSDTVIRLINPKYYGGDYNKMIEILLECKNNGTEFLVGGRIINGVFKVLEDCEIPSELKAMFISIPGEKFRVDISSTELRTNQRS